MERAVTGTDRPAQGSQRRNPQGRKRVQHPRQGHPELTGGDWNQNYRQRVGEEQMMRDGGLVAEAKISVKSGEKEGDEQDAEDDKS